MKSNLSFLIVSEKLAQKVQFHLQQTQSHNSRDSIYAKQSVEKSENSEFRECVMSEIGVFV